MVVPPASSAPRCASPSTPRARPLTTARPAPASSRPSRRATCRPYAEQARAPTIATAGSTRRLGRCTARGRGPAADHGSPAGAAGTVGAPGQEPVAERCKPLLLGRTVERCFEAREPRAARLATRCDSVAAANEASASSSITPPAPSASGRRAPQRRALPRPRPHRQRRRRARDSRDAGAATAGERKRSTARVSSSSAALVRCGVAARSRARASATRGRTVLDASDAPAASSTARGRGHRHDEIETIEESARELVAERREPLRRARALGCRISSARTRAEVHRRDELKASREERLPVGAGDRDQPVLERLPQSFERRPLKLRQLVEEEDTAMGKARLAGARSGPPPTIAAIDAL